MTHLSRLGPDIFIADGESVPFYGCPYPTRMVVVRLEDGDLWVWSPIELTRELELELDALGPVRHLVAPNKLHHLYLGDWLYVWPEARVYAAPGLAKKRPDLAFTAELDDEPLAAWAPVIDQCVVRGSPVMEEVVFFHRPSGTLIVADLIENMDPEHFKPWQRVVGRFAGVLAPDGTAPVDWRMTFLFGKSRARDAVQRILTWQPARVVMAHGRPVAQDVDEFLRRSFAWVLGRDPSAARKLLGRRDRDWTDNEG